MPTHRDHLATHGWSIAPSDLPLDQLKALGDTAFAPDIAGERCLLDQPLVREAAISLRARLIALGVFDHAVAIQAIAFDKSPAANWKVAWHQDLMFPFAAPVTTPGFDLPTTKAGVAYARPPASVLESMLAVRLHLDDCDQTNGPLRVSPGSHRHGILPAREAAAHAREHGELPALATTGDTILMRPLTLHASSPATNPRRRRVLHLVYYSGPPLPEPWHRAV